MSSTSAPFGLRPAYQGTGGTPRQFASTITSGYNTAIYFQQPIKIAADGTVAAAAVNDRFIGTFLGCEYTDSNGQRQLSNKWIANTAGTDIVAYITRDPDIVYEIQSNAALTLADIGEQFDFSAASGNATTGNSSQTLDVASTAANAALRVIGITPGPDNAWGDTYVIAQVMISENQEVADIAAY